MQGILFIAFVLSWLAGFVWMLVYTRQLKKRHPQVHAVIFRDSLQKKIRNDWRLFWFLMRAEYRSQVGPEFARHSDFLRFYILFFFLLMFATVASMVIQ
jgi:hypothetical protein